MYLLIDCPTVNIFMVYTICPSVCMSVHFINGIAYIFSQVCNGCISYSLCISDCPSVCQSRELRQFRLIFLCYKACYQTFEKLRLAFLSWKNK